METQNPIGEIVESSTTSFVAQCLEVPRQNEPRLYDPPAFGSFVKIGRPSETSTPSLLGAGALTLALDEEVDPFDTSAVPSTSTETLALPPAVFALVAGSTTSSFENRRPMALGYDEDELARHQPQIFELLRTDFTGLLIAHSLGDGRGLRRHLPPTPPRIHARVRPCSVEEVRALTLDLTFLRSVLTPAGVPMGVPGDELAAACLREARRAQTDDYQFMVRAGRTLAGILADDYERLQAILRNVT